MDPYLGMIILWAGYYIPENWCLCDGRLLSIKDNTQLFAAFGTLYGGDGVSTFGIPDMRCRVPVGMGQPVGGPTNYVLGQTGGVDYVQLNQATMPAHNHTASISSSQLSVTAAYYVSSAVATESGPAGSFAMMAAPVCTSSDIPNIYSYGPPYAMQSAFGRGRINSFWGSAFNMNNAGASQPHNNIQPTTAMNYILCLQGNSPWPTPPEQTEKP